MDEGGWSGRSDLIVDDEGEAVPKSTAVLPFVAWTALMIAGLVLVVLSFRWNALWVIPGSLMALVGVSQSYRYVYYTHWVGLITAVVAFGGPLVHVMHLLQRVLGH